MIQELNSTFHLTGFSSSNIVFLELPDIFYKGVCLPHPLAETSDKSKYFLSDSLLSLEFCLGFQGVRSFGEM